MWLLETGKQRRSGTSQQKTPKTKQTNKPTTTTTTTTKTFRNIECLSQTKRLQVFMCPGWPHALPCGSNLILIRYSYVLFAKRLFKPLGEKNCPITSLPSQGNQAQIDNIQQPISAWIHTFPACQGNVTFVKPLAVKMHLIETLREWDLNFIV